MVTTPLAHPSDRRKDVECQKFFRKVLKSSFFQVLMISSITASAAFMVLGTNYNIHYRMFRLFEVSTSVLLVYVVCFISENVKLFRGHFAARTFL